VRAADLAITRLAAEQKELLVRGALLDAQSSRNAIAHRLSTGRLRRLYPTVYTTASGELSFEQRSLAAVMASGPGAALDEAWAARPRCGGA